MSSEISERSFEEAIGSGLLQHGPDACAGEANAVRETPPLPMQRAASGRPLIGRALDGRRRALDERGPETSGIGLQLEEDAQ